MKKLLLIGSLMLMSLTAAAHEDGAVTNAKAIELAAHRLDRLVALKKLDASFLKKLSTMEVTVVENQPPVQFKVRVSQTKPEKGNPMQVDLTFDHDGKPLAAQVVAGGKPGPEVGFPSKDAAALSENLLHYVLENNTGGKVALFDKGAKTFTITKSKLKGEDVALGQLTSSSTTEKLNIYVKLDGTFISAEVVP